MTTRGFLLPAMFVAMWPAVASADGAQPGRFVAEIDNRYFPLEPGTTFFYEGKKEGVPTTDVTNVTHRTRRILGVRCTVVSDRAFEDGILVEETTDYFAQDRDGNVWYFGEDTAELDEDGNVISTEGTWRAGVDGAQPGIIMEAHPRVGDRYAQEHAPGVAEDMAQILSLDRSVCVPEDCFDHVLQTREWTPLNPGVVEHKFYAPNVGFIYGKAVKGEHGHTRLVRVVSPHDDDDDDDDDDDEGE